MNFNLAFHKRFWVVEVICLLIIGTVVLFPVSSVNIALSEIFAIVLFVHMFIYRGLLKHEYAFSEFSKKVFWALFAFGIYFVILFGARFMLHLSFAAITWPIRSLILGSIVFFLMDEYKPKINSLLCGILFIYSALNLMELVDCLRFSDIRKLKFLDNINIYMYVCIMFMTFAVWAIKESKAKRLPSWITPVAYVNMGISMVFAFLSGGRMGWVVMGGVLVASFLLVFGLSWYSWKKIILFMLACVLVTILSASVNFMRSRSNVYRSFSPIVSRIPGLKQPPADTDDGDDVQANGEASDKIRGLFWAKAWTAIKKDPILGAGTFAVAYKEVVPVTQKSTGKQILVEKPSPRPAHNFILETWMGWGLGGLILYLAALFSACFYILKKFDNIPIALRICCILPIVVAVIVSLLQSFILLNFQAAYIVWFCLGFASVAEHYYKYGEVRDF